MAKIETPTMALVSERLQSKVGKDLRTFITDARTTKVDDGLGGTADASWDDIAFDLRTITGIRVVRESARQWAGRYGLDMTRPADRAAEAEPVPAN